jgi:HicB family
MRQIALDHRAHQVHRRDLRRPVIARLLVDPRVNFPQIHVAARGASNMENVTRERQRHEESEPYKGFNVRIPEALHARVKAKAALQRIAMQEYVLRLLEASLAQDDALIAKKRS